MEKKATVMQKSNEMRAKNMSHLEIVQIPLLVDNYSYLLHDSATGQTAVIDPSEAQPILKELSQRGWKLDYIFNTHHHFDHVGGNQELKAQTHCKIIGSHHDHQRIPGIDQQVMEGNLIRLGHATAQVLEIPGHTIGHVAYWFQDSKAVFCGDTLFSLGCGRLFEGTPTQMWNSLRRLAYLPRDTQIYCGHEYTEANGRFALSIDPHNATLQAYCAHVAILRAEGRSTIPSTIEIEVAANPFLRAPHLIEALGLGINATPEEAFAELRVRKDHF
jgi:hydroxyacylglutathione hydrolase